MDQLSFILVEQAKDVRPAEVMDLRVMAGSNSDLYDVWEDCIEQSLCIVTARDMLRSALVGVGFVAGNRRHAELTDLTVHRDYRERGVGQMVGRQMLAYTLEQNIRYISLTYDKDTPWLKDWYEREGFRQIDFAMWHKSSLDLAEKED